MKIETKFNVGQEVWFLKKNKIVSDFIDHICMRIDNDGITTLHYHFKKRDGEKATLRTEDYLFETREDLIEQLQG